MNFSLVLLCSVYFLVFFAVAFVGLFKVVVLKYEMYDSLLIRSSTHTVYFGVVFTVWVLDGVSAPV